MRLFARFVLSCIFTGVFFSLPTFAEMMPNEESSARVEQEKMSVLFLLNVKKIDFTKTNTGYELTMHGVEDNIFWFSERPVRKSGFLPATLFVSRWQKSRSSFGKIPPNVAISQCCEKGEKNCLTHVALELSHPKVIASNTWKFAVHVVGGNINEGSYNSVKMFLGF